MTNITDDTQAAAERGKAFFLPAPQEAIIRLINEQKQVYEALRTFPEAAGEEAKDALNAKERELHKKITDCKPHTMSGVQELLYYITTLAASDLPDDLMEGLFVCRDAIQDHRDDWKNFALKREASRTIGALYDNSTQIKRNMDLITQFINGLNIYLQSVVDTVQANNESSYNNIQISLAEDLMKDLGSISDMVAYRLADTEEKDKRQAARIAAMAAMAAA